MHTVQNVTVVFCLACICSELAARLVDGGWARRCIKTVAGLYILVVLLRALAVLPTEWTLPIHPQQSPVQLEGTEQLVLSTAAEQLEAKLQQGCIQRFGLSVQVNIMLEQADAAVYASGVDVVFPAGCTPEEKQVVLEYIQQELGAASVSATEEECNEP